MLANYVQIVNKKRGCLKRAPSFIVDNWQKERGCLPPQRPQVNLT